ncbi:GNAT family N-acetyltransferase [Flavobacteriaceae bacterium]|jgi:ribosomal protein S18 acetylase RimI-like enzyme|nr:GNAT family N-acetyltransferase [Flavobacteriaceae bacterium]
MTYRKATSKDVEHLSELFNAYRMFYQKTSAIQSAKTFLEDRISNKDSEIFVAQNTTNKLVGFVQLYPLFSSTRMKKFWLLNDLFVHPEFRGNGISIGLIQKAKDLVLESKACGMYLETEKSNLIGNHLYPKTGFELNTSVNFYEWNVQ